MILTSCLLIRVIKKRHVHTRVYWRRLASFFVDNNNNNNNNNNNKINVHKVNPHFSTTTTKIIC